MKSASITDAHTQFFLGVDILELSPLAHQVDRRLKISHKNQKQ